MKMEPTICMLRNWKTSYRVEMEINMAERLNKENFDSKITENGLAIIEFYSDSCVPCKRMSPVLAELEEEYAGKVYIGKVNIAYEDELVQKYEVSSVPAFLVFQNGQEKQRLTGVQKKTDLAQIIEEVQ